MATIFKFGPKYRFTSEMIAAGKKLGYDHKKTNGLKCHKCGDHNNVRKFTLGRGTYYACNKCGARWGSLVK